GLITVMGLGYNMWDPTRDHEGALKYLLDNFVKVGAAPGGGADLASGLKAALDGFKLAGGTDKERFIVLFTDGGFTGDNAALDKVLAELKQERVHLLIVGLGGAAAVTVPKYDPTSRQRNGAYEGTTQYEPAILQHMLSLSEGATLIAAPPGSEKVSYNFPQKAGGLYATPKQSNLYVYCLALAMLILLNITFGGGSLPKRKLAGLLLGRELLLKLKKRFSAGS
ncbi:MAG: VWA domain-containing protein, partial [Candidatus Obscuribacterales bacterium]|nr:VWA domain-containing protein [Candidatus Obscuribacterales bacterium]